jgi:uncharacterized protein
MMNRIWQRKVSSPQETPDLGIVPSQIDYGDVEAQFNMGLKFANGEGVAQDYVQAEEWFQKAAQQGHPLAQYYLGKNCHRASLNGLPENAIELRIEAYKWYSLAAAQGYTASELARTTLAVKMTFADVAAGKQRAAEFKVEKLKAPQA